MLGAIATQALKRVALLFYIFFSEFMNKKTNETITKTMLFKYVYLNIFRTIYNIIQFNL